MTMAGSDHLRRSKNQLTPAVTNAGNVYPGNYGYDHGWLIVLYCL